MDNYKIENNKLIFNKELTIEFEHPIKKTLLIQNVIIILIDAPTKVIYNKNVFALSRTGDSLWRVPETELYRSFPDCPYIDIIINPKNQLVLFNWCDTALIVNPETGEVLDKYNSK